MHTRLLHLTITALLTTTPIPAAPSSTSPPPRPKMKTGVIRLRTEYKENPIGIDVRRPRFGWQIVSEERGVAQSAYQVRVARGESEFDRAGGVLWDSGRVNSDESTHVVYDGPPLQSGQRYYWQARVWDASSAASD